MYIWWYTSGPEVLLCDMEYIWWYTSGYICFGEKSYFFPHNLCCLAAKAAVVLPGNAVPKPSLKSFPFEAASRKAFSWKLLPGRSVAIWARPDHRSFTPCRKLLKPGRALPGRRPLGVAILALASVRPLHPFCRLLRGSRSGLVGITPVATCALVYIHRAELRSGPAGHQASRCCHLVLASVVFLLAACCVVFKPWARVGCWLLVLCVCSGRCLFFLRCDLRGGAKSCAAAQRFARSRK